MMKRESLINAKAQESIFFWNQNYRIKSIKRDRGIEADMVLPNKRQNRFFALSQLKIMNSKIA